MKKLLITFVVLVLSSTAFSGETKYKDMPTGINSSLEAILNQYTQKSKKSLPYFNKQFETQKGRTFYIVTRIYQNEFYEQVFVKLSTIRNDFYIGSIASEPMGRVAFKSGDSITVATNKVVDWLIVNADGTEEGSLLGKALDLAQVGQSAFICEMTPKEGVFASFKVVSVINPYTRQEIIEIVPQDVLEKVAAMLVKTHGGKPSQDDKAKYTYTIVRFPGWDIVDEHE